MEAFMQLNRREVLHQLLLATGAVLLEPPMLAEPLQAPAPANNDLLSKMSWMNEPASSKMLGNRLIVRSLPKTDFWRKTFYGYVTDNGHFFHLPVTGDFTFQARVNGDYAALYDQAGLMVRLNAENWMKCGSEFVDSRRHASVVFTHGFSDWSTMPDLSNTDAV